MSRIIVRLVICNLGTTAGYSVTLRGAIRMSGFCRVISCVFTGCFGELSDFTGYPRGIYGVLRVFSGYFLSVHGFSRVIHGFHGFASGHLRVLSGFRGLFLDCSRDYPVPSRVFQIVRTHV